MKLMPPILFLSLASCTTSQAARDAYFERTWTVDASNREVQSFNEYLAWVDSFYRGSAFVPGWTKRQGDLCSSLDSGQARIATPLLECLGRLLSSEWAKDNEHRLIDSERLRIWAEALRQAREEGCLLDTLDRVIADARAILAGNLRAEEVTPKKYGRPLAIQPSSNGHAIPGFSR